MRFNLANSGLGIQTILAHTLLGPTACFKHCHRTGLSSLNYIKPISFIATSTFTDRPRHPRIISMSSAAQTTTLRRSSRLQAKIGVEDKDREVKAQVTNVQKKPCTKKPLQKRKRNSSPKTSESKVKIQTLPIATTPHNLSKDSQNVDDNNLLLLDLGELVMGRVVKRPSAKVRSPYVSDVMLLDKDGNEGETIQAHSPALDVGGLCVPSSIVLMSKRPPGGKTSHAIELLYAPAPDKAIVEGKDGVLVGVHPSLGEKLAEIVLQKGLLQDVIGFGEAKLCTRKRSSPKKKKKTIEESEEEKSVQNDGLILRRQCTYGDSRVDFEITDNTSPHPTRSLVEVKNVVCSDYASDLAPEKTGPNHCVIKADGENYSRTAIFPWGRVGQTFEGKKVVSERAIKHLRNLGHLTATDENINEAIVLFVINRSDCEHMRACHEACPTFAMELKNLSKKKGCKITSFRVRWTDSGKAYFDGVVTVTT